MSSLVVFLTHHSAMQLKLQTRKLPKDVAHIAIYLSNELFIKSSQSPSVALHSSQWESLHHLIEELEHIKAIHGFTQFILCTDANLSLVGGQETSELLKSILQKFFSLTHVILHTQEPLCYDHALDYMETYQQTRPSLHYTICMHDDLLPTLADPETTAPVRTKEIIPPAIDQMHLNSPASVTTARLELPSVGIGDVNTLAPSSQKDKQRKPSLFLCCSKGFSTITPEKSYSP